MQDGRILVTGANGFAGRHITAALAGQNLPLSLAVRNSCDTAPPGARIAAIGDLSERTDWRAALEDVRGIVHTAGLAHRPDTEEPTFMRVNAGGTRALAEAAARAGVTTFINISSIAVYDPTLDPKLPITEAASCRPQTAYGRSKLEAEAFVAEFASPSRSAVQLRPPLIHGPGAPGNWAKLVKVAQLPIPLPSIAPRNRRSVLSVHNLADAILRILDHTRASPVSGAFNITDHGVVSTDELLRAIRRGLGRSATLVPFTAAPLKFAASAVDRAAVFDKLAGDLVIDGSSLCAAFAWTPPYVTLDAIVADLKT